MTRTSAADYPTLGFDPAPGDTYDVGQLARTLSGVSSAMTEISNVLHGAADGEWRGNASVAFRDLLDDELRPKIDKSCDAFDDAHRHISSWSTALDDFQRGARGLETSATEAQERAAKAAAALRQLPDPPSLGAVPPEDHAGKEQLREDSESRRTQRQLLTSANSDVEEFRAQAKKLKGEYAAKGSQIAGLLEHSVDIAPSEPGWLDRVMGAIDDVVDNIGELVADLGDMLLELLEDWAPILAIIGDIAGALSAVLGLLAFIPGLQFLALPALILGGIALVTHYLSAAGKSGSFLDALTDPTAVLDAVSLALGGGAFALAGKLTAAARVSGNTRMVPQLIGGAREVPYGFFNIMRGTVTSMETPEFITRTIGLHATWAGFGATGAGGGSTVNTIGKMFTGNFGPLLTPGPSPVTR